MSSADAAAAGARGGSREGEGLAEFVSVMRRLRRECNWKAAQTHASLARYLLEESWEVLEAIDGGDPAWLREELGDLLLQIYFHAEIASEAGEFTIDDVVADLRAKMVRRNPHVFGPEAGSAATAAMAPEEIDRAWQELKRSEPRKGPDGSTSSDVGADPLGGLPAGLPALLWATKALERLEAVAPTTDAELGSTADPVELTAEELGESLLDLVRRARAAGLDAEQALRIAVRRHATHR